MTSNVETAFTLPWALSQLSRLPVIAGYSLGVGKEAWKQEDRDDAYLGERKQPTWSNALPRWRLDSLRMGSINGQGANTCTGALASWGVLDTLWRELDETTEEPPCEVTQTRLQETGDGAAHEYGETAVCQMSAIFLGMWLGFYLFSLPLKKFKGIKGRNAKGFLLSLGRK